MEGKDPNGEVEEKKSAQPPSGEEFAAEKRIEEISGDEARVSVIGTVISRDPGESSMVLDDGTGQIDARVPRLPELGSLARVIGRAFTSEGKVMLDTAIVQDFSGFDVELYRKVTELEERVFKQENDSPL